MAIKIKGPTSNKISTVKEFTDRTDSRAAFWDRYIKMVQEGSTIISFYGAGGVGKTALLKQIEEEIKRRDSYIKLLSESDTTSNFCGMSDFGGTVSHDNYKDKKFKYIKYDFSLGTDLREVLKTLKFQLESYGCEFPFFDSGNYYYSLKVGKDITPLKAKSMLQDIPWVNVINKKLKKTNDIIWKASPLLNVAKNLFKEVVDTAFQVSTVSRAIMTCFSLVDSLLQYHMEKNKVLDDDHKEVRNQLNARRQERNSAALYEYFPTLFAMDVADWIKKTGGKLVVILDNYESLISETSLATPEQLKRDLWLRGDDGLIFMLPDTLWVVAGRNELHWSGDLAEELEDGQHLIKELSLKASDEFLKHAGILNDTLRGELFKLTKGYPIFLDLCVDTYFEYKRKHDSEPSIAEFGKKREEVIGRILSYVDAEKDDAAKDMLEFLCVLNSWTDELATDIGGKALHNYSHNTYKRVKEFSFIRKDDVEFISEEIDANETFDSTLYHFDRTIADILIATCNKKLIEDTKNAVDNYFKDMFNAKKVFNSQEIFCLKLWAEFIVRFADNADNLSKKYNELLKAPVLTLTDSARFVEAEEILKLFMNKLENLGVTDTVAYTYFEMDLGWLKRVQGNYNEAHEIINSAYEKRSRFLGDEHIETVKAMHKLAISLSDLDRCDKAWELREKVLAFRKKHLGDEHPDTVIAMNNSALSLRSLGRYNEALELQEKVLALSKKIHGDEHPDTLDAMNNLALTLNDLERRDEALALQEEALTLSKKIFGDEYPDTIATMNNLANTLNALERYDEALALQKKILSLSKKILGNEHPNTLAAMNNLANTLRDLGHHAEALKRKEKLLALSKKILGDNHSYTMAIMYNLAVSLNDLGRCEEALKLQEQVLALSKKEPQRRILRHFKPHKHT